MLLGLRMKKKIKLTNMFVNGDFANGATGWLTSNVDLNVVNKIAYVQPIGIPVSPTATHHIYQSIILNNYSKYYLKSNCYGNTSVQLKITSAVIAIITSDNLWLDISGVYSSTVIGSRACGLRDTLISDWQQFRCTNMVLINLTESFGLGNEPTKEQMDVIMDRFPNRYFNGTIYI